ncbi:hypothetical protein PCK1_002897 [Pneumocystis canis]|nr:hypothetical protein PCK1_002897 [Pneumocystis canis]
MYEDKENIPVRTALQTPAQRIHLSSKLGYTDGFEGQDPKGYSTASLITPLHRRQILGGKDTNARNIPISVFNPKSFALNSGLSTIHPESHNISVKKPGIKSSHKSLRKKPSSIYTTSKSSQSEILENIETTIDPEYMPPKEKALEHHIPGFSPIDWSTLQAWPHYRSYFNPIDDQGQSELERCNQIILGEPNWEPMNSVQHHSHTDFLSDPLKKTGFSSKQITSFDDIEFIQHEMDTIHKYIFPDEPFPFEFENF